MRQGKYRPPARRQAAPEPALRWVDLNSATAVEIEKLPGVNLTTAEAIVARRPLRGWDDLRGLPGVSEGLIKQLRATGARIAPAARPAGNM
ncbi:MAG TPA: helix-hairpin-helix domain-containing protein [Bryobacteraceae bacterium]|nr:helix-hairpin-helix domain-containing protein [Bryobacteraceae bacterium]